MIFTITEYVLLPLVAIVASFNFKKVLKRENVSIENFLADLNIDIKILSSFGLILFSINLISHNENGNSIVYILGFSGFLLAFILYIIIHSFYSFKTVAKERSIKYFGIRNSYYKDSSWFLFSLIVFVFVSLLVKKSQNYGRSISSLNNYLLLCIVALLLMLICTSLFMKLLNIQVRQFLYTNSSHFTSYNNSFINDDDDIKNNDKFRSYQLIEATIKSDDPLLIAVYGRMANISEKNGDLNLAEIYLDKVITLLKNTEINQDIDYLKDGYAEKLDFYKRHNLRELHMSLSKELRKKYPGDERFEFGNY